MSDTVFELFDLHSAHVQEALLPFFSSVKFSGASNSVEACYLELAAQVHMLGWTDHGWQCIVFVSVCAKARLHEMQANASWTARDAPEGALELAQACFASSPCLR